MKQATTIGLISALLAAAAPAAMAAPDGQTPFDQGARCLFAGHSFFVPVAEAFDDVAAQNVFPQHQIDTVFRGGPAGAPGAMWSDPATRAEIEAILAGGVDLFGLTTFGGLGSAVEDYALWFDLALVHNPETTFFIGVPWVFGGPSLATEVFDASIEQAAETAFQIVEQLREAYPDHTIHAIAYGKTASVMKGMFEAGTLPDIDQLVGLGPKALFADGLMGHAGPLMLEVASLSWIDVLYGAEVGSLTLDPYQSDIASIAEQVLAYNEPFEPSPPVDALSADVESISLSAGGTQTLSLDAGVDRAGDLYLVLGSLSGTGPTPIPGTSLELPLTLDAYFDLTLTAGDLQLLFGTLGTLEGAGQAQAQIFLPADTGPALAGQTAHHAYVVLEGDTVDLVSHAVALALTP